MKSKFVLRAVTTTAIALLSANAASALTINLIDQGGVTGSQAEQGFKIAAAYWESVITNNVTLNFGVGYSNLGAGIIGSTGSAGMDYTVKNFETGFNATKSNSTLDQTAILPTLSASGAMSMITSGPATGQLGVNTAANKRVYDTDTTGTKSTNNKVLYLNTSVVQAVGGTAVYDSSNTQHLDADITFSSTFGFDFDPSNGTSPSTFDFIGTAIHEMGHALGFVSGVDEYDYYGRPNGPGKASGATFNFNTTSWFSSLDLFRYSNDPTNLVAGTTPVLDMAVNSPAYFSIDGGAHQVLGGSLFATGSYNGDGDQASHWKDNNGPDGCSVQLGIMDPTECYAQADYVTALDLAAIDAIGWNLNVDALLTPGYHKTTAQIYADYQAAHQPAAVPEPASWAMMLAGFGLIGGMMRRRSVKVAFAA
jgi:spore maturation protein SpmB